MLDPITTLQQNGHTAIVMAVVMTVLTTGAVAVRLMSKAFTGTKWGASEWLILLAQILWIVQTGLQIHGLTLGRQIQSFMDPKLETWLKMSYIAAEFYFPIVFCTNLSLIFLYRSIFSIDSYKRMSDILTIIHVLWFIPAFFGETFMCVPINIFWKEPLAFDVKCINYSYFFIAMMSFELLLDVLVLVLPIKETLGLRMPWEKRFMLISIFLLGGMTIIAGIVRIVLSVDLPSHIVDLVVDIIWLDVHVGVSIICACIPTFRPVISKGLGVMSSSIRKAYGSGSGSRSGGGGTTDKTGSKGSSGLGGGGSRFTGSGKSERSGTGHASSISDMHSAHHDDVELGSQGGGGHWSIKNGQNQSMDEVHLVSYPHHTASPANRNYSRLP